MNPSFQNLPVAGLQLAPGRPMRIAPPEWRSYRMVLATTSAFIVPANVFQILGMVWGGGGTAIVNNSSGGGGGFAMGILDVVPGQLLPPITVGAAQATSSIGTLLSATGASGITAGTGTAAANLRGAFTASGGTGSNNSNRPGAASGSPLGVGGSSAEASQFGGSAWGDRMANSTTGASTPVSGATGYDGYLALANGRSLPGVGGTSATALIGLGCGAFSSDVSTNPVSPLGGGGWGNVTYGGAGGLGGGGGGSASTTAGTGGAGLVLLFWTEGF